MENFDLFLGRFHPLVVHLPIGFLILAAVFGLMSLKEKYANLKSAYHLSLLLGAISSVVAVILGFLLAGSGGYNENALGWHKWMGIGVAVLAIGLYLINRKPLNLSFNINKALIPLMLIVLTVAGHLGGNLTHGSQYLTEHAPQFIKTIAGAEPQGPQPQPVTNLDSAVVFRDLVLPVIQAKCKSCHGEEKQKGELVLTTHPAIMVGGKSGNTIIAGNVDESELIKRVLLPEDHEDVMPPEGKTPLTEEEIALLEWWVKSGATDSAQVADLAPDSMAMVTLASVTGKKVDTDKKQDVMPPDPGPLAEVDLEALEKLGFMVKALAQNSNWYEADFSLAKQEFTSEHMQALQNAAGNLLHLYLNNAELTDEHLNGIGELKNLTKLRLDNNMITDATVQRLAGLENLYYLNLYGTDVSAQCLSSLDKIPTLRKVYLWQTGIQEADLAVLTRKDLEVVMGMELKI